VLDPYGSAHIDDDRVLFGTGTDVRCGRLSCSLAPSGSTGLGCRSDVDVSYGFPGSFFVGSDLVVLNNLGFCLQLLRTLSGGLVLRLVYMALNISIESNRNRGVLDLPVSLIVWCIWLRNTTLAERR
jgi:hypothetical protein